MAFNIWRLQGDEMNVVPGEWTDGKQAEGFACTLTEQTGAYHVAVEQGSEYEQLLLTEKERREHPSPVNANPEHVLHMIEDLERKWQRGEISYENCSQQQVRWYRILAQVDGR